MNAPRTTYGPMFLPQVEQNPKPSVYRDLIESARASGGDAWQIWHLLAFDPEAAHHLATLSHKLMHKASPLNAGLRELIAAYTSSLNKCEFCMKAHAAVASQILADEQLVWSVIRDLDSSPLPEKEKALLHFVRKVTLDCGSINASDIEQLRAAGWDDAEIFYAISACALFNFYNRWVSASGIQPVSDEAFKRLASRMAVKGYSRE
jgi:uncharacterized peroxidase-related enzyme